MLLKIRTSSFLLFCTRVIESTKFVKLIVIIQRTVWASAKQALDENFNSNANPNPVLFHLSVNRLTLIRPVTA